jgi:hypothetical protein
MVFRLSRLEHPFMLYEELFGDIMRWLKKTGRRGKGADGRKAEDAPHEERQVIECYREHLDGFAELADAVERWLEETGR